MTPDHQIVSKTIEINAPRALVWDALINPGKLNLWMADGDFEIITDWKVGSEVHVKAGKYYTAKGIILQFEPGKILEYTSWSQIMRLKDEPGNYSHITFRLSADGNATLLELTHNNLVAEASYEHSNFYWFTALEELKKLVENTPVTENNI